jgi:tRNA(Ile)-lysidine synthase
MKIESDLCQRMIDYGMQYKLPIVVGVSGGADSLALLHILYRSGYTVTAVYIDHMLRESSQSDGVHVQELSAEWQIPFITRKVPAADYAQKMKLAIEEASRELRYTSLFEIAQSMEAQAVVVAHHADDQVETVLMHLLRGCGLSGLRGIVPYVCPHAWHESIPLIRPMITSWKKDILAYCQENNIVPVTDDTNFDTTYFRNRLRHELIPDLLTYNAGVKQHLLTMSGLIQDDYAFLQLMADEASQRTELRCQTRQVTFLKEPFLTLPCSMQRMLLRKAIDILRPALRDVDTDTVERCIEFVQTADGSRIIDVTGLLVMFMDGERMVLMESGNPYFRDDLPLLDEAIHASIRAGEDIPIHAGWFFRFDILKIEDNQDFLSGKWTAILDADSCGETIYLKTVQPGDRYTPLGLKGHYQKLSDILINQKVSRWVRASFPVIWNEKEILWVPGYRINTVMQSTSRTRRVLVMQFFRKRY